LANLCQYKCSTVTINKTKLCETADELLARLYETTFWHTLYTQDNGHGKQNV